MNNELEKELKEVQIQYDKVCHERNKLKEILDIIKKSIKYKEIHTYVVNEKMKGQKFMQMQLSIKGDNDFNKVKEWLENE